MLSVYTHLLRFLHSLYSEANILTLWSSPRWVSYWLRENSNAASIYVILSILRCSVEAEDQQTMN